jgi:hypothetical protein
VLTLRAYKHLGLTGPARSTAPQIGLFDQAPDGDEEENGRAGTG